MVRLSLLTFSRCLIPYDGAPSFVARHKVLATWPAVCWLKMAAAAEPFISTGTFSGIHAGHTKWRYFTVKITKALNSSIEHTQNINKHRDLNHTERKSRN